MGLELSDDLPFVGIGTKKDQISIQYVFCQYVSEINLVAKSLIPKIKACTYVNFMIRNLLINFAKH